MDYFVIAPFDVLSEKEFCEKKEELAKSGRKVIAVVLNCENYDDFSRKYFGK